MIIDVNQNINDVINLQKLFLKQFETIAYLHFNPSKFGSPQ